MPERNGFVNMCVSPDASHKLGQSRFQAYVKFVRSSGIFPTTAEIDEIAMELYRWNAEASAVLMRYIPWVEVLVRNAIDEQLRLWLARQAPQSYDDWIDVDDTHPMDRIRALVNTAEKQETPRWLRGVSGSRISPIQDMVMRLIEMTSSHS